jgi:hypothetical protein
MRTPCYLLLLGALVGACDLLGGSGGGGGGGSANANTGGPPASGAVSNTSNAGNAGNAGAGGPAASGPAGAKPGVANVAGAEGPAAGALPGPKGDEILAFITKTSPYPQWKKYPQDRYPISIAADFARPGAIRFFNGMISRVYLNEVGQEAFAAGQKELPAGAMIVAERWVPKPDGSLGPEGSPDDILVSYKIAGFDAAHADWFFLAIKGGKIGVEGAGAKKCQDCHSLVKDNDFRFIDSGSMDLLSPKPPVVTDKGEAFAKMLTQDLHYTHYNAFPDDAIPQAIPRSKDLSGGIEWFNGKLGARVYGNALAMAALKSGGKVYPSGSLLIAEQFQKDKDKTKADPFAIVAQIKIDGADPKHNDWVWISYDLQKQKILAFGKEANFCYDCHLQVSDNDFVWTTSGKLPEKKEK